MKSNFNEIINKQYNSEIFDIQKIVFEKSKLTLTVDMIFNEIVLLNSIEELKEKIKNELTDISEIKINYKFRIKETDTRKIIENYWDNILYAMSKKSSSLDVWLREAKWTIIDNVLEITLNDAYAIETIIYKNYDKYLSRILKKHLGIDLKLEFLLDKEKDFALTSSIDDKKNDDIKEHLKTLNTAPREKTTQKRSDNTSGGMKYNNKKNNSNNVYRNKITRLITMIDEANEEEGIFAFEGKIFEKNLRDLKNGKGLISFAITDYSNSINCKLFAKEKEKNELFDKLNIGDWYKVEGTLRYDTFDKEMAFYIMNINSGKKEIEKEDNAKVKRVELHCHTNMSDMDGITPVKELVRRAKKWGHPSIAITDHGVLQAFPDAMNESGDDIKIIYGLEGYLINDNAEIVINADDSNLDQEFVVFDIETTGLSYKNSKITEIGAIKVVGGSIVDRFSELVNPEIMIPDNIVELTGITDEMVKNKETIDKILPKFLQFVGDSPVVAHNAKFDVSFIKENARKINAEFNPRVLDTLSLSRLLLKSIKRHKLSTVAKHLKIKLENHHRAIDDALATAKIFIEFISRLKEKEINTLNEINEYALKEMDYKMQDTYHVIILVKNYVGLKNLYKIVSESNLETFYKKPRIPKSRLSAMREGLIIGTACEAGELFRAILENKTENDIKNIIDFYDYLEIQPIGNNQFLVEKGIAKDKEELKEFNRRIVNYGEKYSKTVVATGDVHFIDPDDEVYRRILMAGKGFSDADNQPPLYYRTTDEMIDEFEYLGQEKAYEVVVKNTNDISNMIDDILPVPSETSPPRIEGSDDELRDMCYKKARRIYGDELPEIVEARLERELNSIISNGYAVMYIIAQKLVCKSLDDGYLVGSRGSVGSSFAATMSDITEVNPLAPHYVCPNSDCKNSEFILDGSIGSGADLPDKICPKCGATYIKDGHDIPFEVFLGFEGDKEPDIDLNFAGVYQANAHKYTEVLFGTGYVFKAGTIGTIADKTAYGYVKKYFEERGLTANSKEIVRLAKGCTGVKRTSGQHPGGIMVVPDYKEIYDFCPIQYPANDTECGVITTHFDYHSISGRLLKLDILGHDVPTIIKELEELTGVNVQDIALDNKETVSIFTSTDTLNIIDKDYSCETGSLGIPEFGTKFVRQMLVDTKPSTFAELVRISGLSHGTDVWINNAQDLVKQGKAMLKDVISTRDDIMNYLIYKNLPPKASFTIMERVRKGKGLTDENIAMMKEFNVPEWYIWSCNQIKYMFPKAHAVAYVMMSFRIAYFKVHHPLAFYSTYFGIKVDDFDADLANKGKEAVRNRMKELSNSLVKLTKKEQDLFSMLEVIDEMYSRGYEFLKVDLYKSDAEKFKIVDGKILPPLRGLQGLGENAAKAIALVRDDSEFLSIEDIKKRTKSTKTVIEALREHGCITGLPESNQLSFF
ncbi:PolC-type DNA polymerase III [Helicovermis profundi]|uniref:DNA polymerase III PolC-type n=1 Tax=Helicovermis profundi TaxID=3065157 RepID=A0AAU9E435_9FIRM|nr:PolC-type DNA polymerase III [Clostridia bacterium S502]